MAQPEEAPLLAIVTDDLPSLTESFIQSHLEDLPARIVHVYGWRPMIAGRPVLPLHRRVAHTIRRRLTGGDMQAELTEAYMRAFRHARVSAVLAEYGEVGADVVEACRRLGLPLTVHFHGYDASAYRVLSERRGGYQAMFKYAAAIIAVSRTMESQLLELGALRERLHYNPYGVDLDRFEGATPADVPPGFLTVGRFVPKKAPDLALHAFARVHALCPEARLLMIGGGPMLEDCRKLAVDLGIDAAVELPGFVDHGAVQRAMVSARCFVQHSIVAPNGDSEGLPVAILEAAASGLPVIATRHAGIPDVVVEGVTGYLVDEGDVNGMAAHMLRLARDPALAARLGVAGRSRIQENFEVSRSLGRLWDIISAGIERQAPPARSEAANRQPG
jgi:glycosyltransferase involved in cell wall biosynthesis